MTKTRTSIILLLAACGLAFGAEQNPYIGTMQNLGTAPAKPGGNPGFTVSLEAKRELKPKAGESDIGALRWLSFRARVANAPGKQPVTGTLVVRFCSAAGVPLAALKKDVIGLPGGQTVTLEDSGTVDSGVANTMTKAVWSIE